MARQVLPLLLLILSFKQSDQTSIMSQPGCCQHHIFRASQNLYEYLRDVESQLGADSINKNANKYTEDVTNRVLEAPGADDANICGGIVQLHQNSILEICLDVN